MENEIDNKINNEKNNEIGNNINLEQKQDNFFSTILEKTINSAIDMGLRTILPDLIENQIIDIKNSLFENGVKGGINTALKSIKDFGKSVMGIFTGNFENISQMQTAIGNGGIIDTISDVLDMATDKIYQKGHINKSVNNVIKSGKNVILENIENNIKNELENQNNLIEKLENNIKGWKASFEKKDFDGMSKEYKQIEEKLEKIAPLESVFKKTKEVKALHNLIKNNGQNFNISEEEKEVAIKLY